MGNFNQYNPTPETRIPGVSYTQTETDSTGNAQVTLGTTLDPSNDGVRTYPDGSSINLTASALVKTGAGRVQGVIINSHTSGTLKLWDSLTATGTVLNETISFGVGERFIPLFGERFATGLFATIGGTANITIVFN
jgi:hypothetical protein